MLNLKSWKTGTAALLALTVTSSAIAPLVTSAPASAQSRYPRTESYSRYVAAGTSIRVRYDKEKVLLLPDEKVPLTLTVAQDVLGSDGRVVIPEGSEIKGELRPAYRGTQFVAKELTLYRNRRDRQSNPYYINANSNVVTRTEEVSKSNTRSILTGTAVGAGAAAALAAITGDRAIATEEVLGGAGLGALGGWLLNRNKKATMVAVYPEQDLTLRLRSELALR